MDYFEFAKQLLYIAHNPSPTSFDIEIDDLDDDEDLCLVCGEKFQPCKCVEHE